MGRSSSSRAVAPELRTERLLLRGWRLAHAHWRQGYATEAAQAAIEFGFGEAGRGEIVSFTAVVNHRSQAVMQCLGMTHDPADDFDHPTLPTRHSLRPHVLYRMRRRDWEDNLRLKASAGPDHHAPSN